MANKPFQINLMNDAIMKATNDIAKTARRQLPSFDSDQLMMGILQLVGRIGGSSAVSNTVSPASPITPATSPYYSSLASLISNDNAFADYLILAHAHYKQKDYKNALKILSLAMEDPGSDQFIDILEKITEQADAESTDTDDSDSKNEDDSDTKDEDDDNQDDTDDEVTAGDDSEGDSRFTSAIKAARKNRKDGQDPKEIARTVANKVSLSGTRTQRITANKILDEA